MTQQHAEIVARDLPAQSPEWHELRRQGLGGSDAPIVAGLSRWRSPYDLWCEKTAEGPLPDEPARDYLAWGHFMEEPIAAWFNHQAKPLTAQRLPVVLRSRAHPFMQANLDFVVVDEAGAVLGPLEVKNRRYADGWETADDGTVNVPLDVLAQGMHYLGVGGWDRCWFAASLSGAPPVIAEVERTAALLDDLVALEAAFMDQVTRRIAPDVDGTDSTRKALARRWQVIEAKAVELRPEPTTFLLAERKRLLEEVAERKAVVDEIENELCSMLATAEVGTLEGEVAVTWKQVTRRSLDTAGLKAAHPAIAAQFQKSSSYRRFGVGKLWQPQKETPDDPE